MSIDAIRAPLVPFTIDASPFDPAVVFYATADSPMFVSRDGGRSFSINQKWTWQKFGVYVCKVVPKLFCRKFGVAAKSMQSTLTGKIRKMFAGYPSIARAFGLK